MKYNWLQLEFLICKQYTKNLNEWIASDEINRFYQICKQSAVLAATWDSFSPQPLGSHQMSFLFVLSGTAPRECFTLSISERIFLILSSHLKCCPQGKCAALKGVSSTLMRNLIKRTVETHYRYTGISQSISRSKLNFLAGNSSQWVSSGDPTMTSWVQFRMWWTHIKMYTYISTIEKSIKKLLLESN